MLKLTRQSDYAILLLEHLVYQKDYVPLSRLVQETKLPQRFLARIAALLVNNKILESKEGKVGGYKISKYAKKITLFKFLEIFEGKISFAKCEEQGYQCDYSSICRHKNFIRTSLDAIVGNALKRVTLKDLLYAS